MASSLDAQWCFSFQCILLQRWSLVPFKWLHKGAKLSQLEFREPSYFSNNIAASLSPKIGAWCAMSRERVVVAIFLEAIITAEVYHDIIQQFIALLHKDEHDTVLQQDNAWSHVSKDTMSFLAEFFGEWICKWQSCSSDLSSLDFFLWSYHRDIVYNGVTTHALLVE